MLQRQFEAPFPEREGKERISIQQASSGSFPLTVQSTEGIFKCIFCSRTHCWECQGTGDLQNKTLQGFFVVKRTLNNVLIFFKMNALLEQKENTPKRTWEV